MIYKGVDISKHKYLTSYVSTYYLLDSDNIIKHLDNDRPFQKMIAQHKLREKIYITLFNLMPYFIVLSIFLTKGQ